MTEIEAAATAYAALMTTLAATEPTAFDTDKQRLHAIAMAAHAALMASHKGVLKDAPQEVSRLLAEAYDIWDKLDKREPSVKAWFEALEYALLMVSHGQVEEASNQGEA